MTRWCLAEIAIRECYEMCSLYCELEEHDDEVSHKTTVLDGKELYWWLPCES